jgi:hypothetical protein
VGRLSTYEGAAPYVLAHVLACDLSTYEQLPANAEQRAVELARLLTGCRCGRCGSDLVEPTRASVERGLQPIAGYRRVMLWLARCQACGARERVLPADVLPGKVCPDPQRPAG